MEEKEGSLTKLLSVKSLSTSSKKPFKKASVLGFWCFHGSKQIPKHVLAKSDKNHMKNYWDGSSLGGLFHVRELKEPNALDLVKSF